MTAFDQFLRDLAVVLVTAGVVAVVFFRLRWPLVAGYLLAGVLVGPHLPPRLVRAVAAHEAPGPPGDGGDLAVFIHAACGISNLLGFVAPGEPVARPLSPEVMARVGPAQNLAGALPGILAELRSWGLLDHGKPDDWPGPGAGAAYTKLPSNK